MTTARAIAMAALVIHVPGCGGDGHGFPMAEVSGTVTYRGQPLDGGTIVLHPIDGTPGPQSMAAIGDDGTFSVQTLGVNGAAVGVHRVTVDYRRQLSEAEARNLVIPELLIPSRYASFEQTPLEFTIVGGDENNLEIMLEDQPES